MMTSEQVKQFIKLNTNKGIYKINSEDYRPRLRKDCYIEVSGTRYPGEGDTGLFVGENGQTELIDFENMNEKNLQQEFIGLIDGVYFNASHFEDSTLRNS